MAIQVQLRRGTTAQNNSFTGAVAETTVDTDKDTLVVHDGSTAGGHPLAKESGGSLANPSIVGGTINNAVIGGTTRAAGNFTSLDANGNVVLGDATSDTISANGRFNTNIEPSTNNARDLGASALRYKDAHIVNVLENGFNIVSQTDIGTSPNEIPLNQYLGNLAFQSSNAVVLNPVALAVPSGIGDMVFQLTDDTTLVVKVKGSDGTIRSTTLTLV